MPARHTFLRCCTRIWWLPFLAAALGAGGTAVWQWFQPTRHISKAALVLSGQKIQLPGTTAEKTEYKMMWLEDFPGTVIETLESEEMMRRAVKRLAAQEQKPSIPVVIKARTERSRGVVIIRAYGADPDYTRLLLNALLDEFAAFREQIREQQRNKAFTSLAEDVVRREKRLQLARDQLTHFEKLNPSSLLTAESQRLDKLILRLRDERDQAAASVGKNPDDKSAAKELNDVSARLAEAESNSKPIAAALSEYLKLSAELETSQKSFDAILDFVRRMVVHEELHMNAVTILERASPCVTDAAERRSAILNNAVFGFLIGLALWPVVSVLLWLGGIIRNSHLDPT